MSTVRSVDVVLAARSATEAEAEAVDLRLRVVARPDKMVAELLAHLGLLTVAKVSGLSNASTGILGGW